MNQALVDLAVQEIPDIIARLKELFAGANPDAVEPTDEEVIAAYQSAFQSSVEKDDAWLEAHPEDPSQS